MVGKLVREGTCSVFRDTLIIGDDLTTDIALATAVGCASVLVETGKHTGKDVSTDMSNRQFFVVPTLYTLLCEFQRIDAGRRPPTMTF